MKINKIRLNSAGTSVMIEIKENTMMMDDIADAIRYAEADPRVVSTLLENGIEIEFIR